ncbi:hypothetical protein Csa_020625 [Cucumis sativus]|uniref:Uncharacterized protein n=1 Tax=Cucumis sativus TaxID=3659 RepID=A0A0A0KE37_CUCSA|nr:hypothetical protein Csa_020625 [Cucumis sativus]
MKYHSHLLIFIPPDVDVDDPICYITYWAVLEIFVEINSGVSAELFDAFKGAVTTCLLQPEKLSRTTLQGGDLTYMPN